MSASGLFSSTEIWGRIIKPFATLHEPHQRSWASGWREDSGKGFASCQIMSFTYTATTDQLRHNIASTMWNAEQWISLSRLKLIYGKHPESGEILMKRCINLKKADVGGGNDLTPELTAFQYNQSGRPDGVRPTSTCHGKQLSTKPVEHFTTKV